MTSYADQSSVWRSIESMKSSRYRETLYTAATMLYRGASVESTAFSVGHLFEVR